MKKRVCYYSMALVLLFNFTPIKSEAGNIIFEGNSFNPIFITPTKDTGLDGIYVLYNLQNTKLRIANVNPGKIRISQFSNLGAAFQTPVEDITIEDDAVVINAVTPNSGYVIEENETPKYLWIVDYSSYEYDIKSIKLSEENSCDATVLDVEGDAKPIRYYTINGRQENISRDIELSYMTLVFDNESKQFVQSEVSKNIAYIIEKISVNPPVLCNTSFNLKGDRFLKEWNKEIETESQLIFPIATSVFTDVTDDNNQEESSNQISSATEGLGGSAPCTLSFNAYVSDAVIHNEWQMANDESFEDITYRINEQDLEYTFTEEGTTYLRFIGSNSDGSCETIGETYTVTIGTSELKIPNAFSPNGDGINDIWKVSYRSLIEFKCWIFDRNGHEIFSFDSPDLGWDGKRNGKNVKPGVYYYVIQALGADGKRYKRSGDINIINGSNFRQNQGE